MRSLLLLLLRSCGYTLPPYEMDLKGPPIAALLGAKSVPVGTVHSSNPVCTVSPASIAFTTKSFMQSLQVVTPGMVSPDLVGLRDLLLDTDIFSLVLGISSAPQ